uniref:Cytohesin 4b n=1 Tax=Oncorhynchus mykiss TaxID=8022 RepID=A0A8K9XS30_ONCMY
MTDCQMVSSDFTADERLEIESMKMHKRDLLEDIQKLKMEIDKVMAEVQDFESTEENKVLEKGKQFSSGKKKFNMDPKKGINYLVENKLLERNPQPIAEFLYKEEGLNKTAIGDYLGEREDLHLQTLKAFVDLHEFSDLNLVQALRQFLWSFRLPGEAQKIDRMMETFATRYCDCNTEVFQSTDTCYILSFAIIMLNTSLHNPNVKDKTPLERFISMNRGINNGGDLPNELLTKLYDSIRNEPFKIPEDDGNDLTHTFFNPDREGWLLKLGGRVKTWKRRWFILTDNCLYYFEYTTVSLYYFEYTTVILCYFEYITVSLCYFEYTTVSLCYFEYTTVSLCYFEYTTVSLCYFEYITVSLCYFEYTTVSLCYFEYTTVSLCYFEYTTVSLCYFEYTTVSLCYFEYTTVSLCYFEYITVSLCYFEYTTVSLCYFEYTTVSLCYFEYTTVSHCYFEYTTVSLSYLSTPLCPSLSPSH